MQKSAAVFASLALLVCGLGGCPSPSEDEGSARQSLPRSADLTILRRLPVAPGEPNAKVSHIDIDRDGRDEIVVASAQGLAVFSLGDQGEISPIYRANAHGGATAITSGDIDRDGFDDLIVGWGAHRDHRDAPATLVVYRTAGAAPGELIEEIVVTPPTTRAQFTSLLVTPLATGEASGILYGHFASKYDVRSGFAELSQEEAGLRNPRNPRNESAPWRDRTLGQIRMGSSLAAIVSGQTGEPATLVVGRPYGDGVKSDGDVFTLSTRDPGFGGTRVPVRSFRGVRSLEVLEIGTTDNPLRLLCFGDGWHWRYREEGRGLLSCARLAEGTEALEQPLQPFVVAEMPDYALDTLRSADLDGDGEREIVAQGVDGTYRFTARVEDNGLVWEGDRLGPGGFHFDTLDVDGDGRDEIITGGELPTLLFFHGS